MATDIVRDRACVRGGRLFAFACAATRPAAIAGDGNADPEYVADYGETLVALPEDTWQTSEALWMGSFWDVFVDLWTAEEGRSDMVLAARVLEIEGGYEFEVHSVHVP